LRKSSGASLSLLQPSPPSSPSLSFSNQLLLQ
jgi:hypothetical protein